MIYCRINPLKLALMREAMKRRYKTLKEAIKELGEGFGIQLVDR